MDISNISSSQLARVQPGSLRPRSQAPASGAAAGEARDRIEVSPEARALARAEQAVEDSGDLRIDVVSQLRSSVRAGTYRVDPRAVARAMVERGEQAE